MKINWTNPTVVYADMRLVDENGKIKEQSINNVRWINYVNKYSLFFSHIVAGCNMMTNSANFFQVPQIDVEADSTRILSNDNLCAKYAAMTGDVIFIDSTTMSYRRHGEM